MMKILSPVFKKEHPHPLALQQGRQCSLNDSCHETLYQIPNSYRFKWEDCLMG